MDPGFEATEELIARVEKEIGIIYKQAEKELKAKAEDYFRRFEAKDETWRRWVKEGKKSKKEYEAWRTSQMMVGERWKQMQETIAKECHNANVTARRLVEISRPGAFAEGFNYGLFEIEKGLGVKTSFTLYNESTVAKLMVDNPDLLQAPGERMKRTFKDFEAYRKGDLVNIKPEEQKAYDKLIAEGKDIRWQKKQLNSCIMQGVLQGESIPNLTKRIANTLGEVNHKSTIRYARTALHSAQNMGRMTSYRNAIEKGVKLEKMWIAVIDMRTRHKHRELDGQVRPVDEPFEAGGETIMQPCDPEASPSMIWNCRCTTKPVVDGWESISIQGRSLEDLPEDMDYEGWKESKEEISHPITKQEDTAEAMRWKYINEYRKKR